MTRISLQIRSANIDSIAPRTWSTWLNTFDRGSKDSNRCGCTSMRRQRTPLRPYSFAVRFAAGLNTKL